MPTREQLLSCVKEFKQNNDPITITKVADKFGVSHSLIYNRHPDIAEMITKLKKHQKKQTLIKQQKDQTEKLLKRNEKLEHKLFEANKNDDKETIAMLITHIQELYSMYDSLLEERNAFANRLYEIEK